MTALRCVMDSTAPIAKQQCAVRCLGALCAALEQHYGKDGLVYVLT